MHWLVRPIVGENITAWRFESTRHLLDQADARCPLSREARLRCDIRFDLRERFGVMKGAFHSPL